ncbi:MAG: HAD-IC family P-type ATPase [Anaerolineae bacterium]
MEREALPGTLAHDSIPVDANVHELTGLTEREVLERRSRGQGNNVKIDTSRTYAEILRQNFLTFINIILFGIGLLMVLLGLYGDAVVSVGVVLMNVVVGVVQEFRAKAKLDRIALLTRPKATVIREGQQKTVDPSEIVLGDIIVAAAGDQIVVDGVVVGDGKMDVDESLLTGESDLIPKVAGDEVFSGSFAVTGSAAYEATRVGAESFANKLTASARKFVVMRTPLQRNINFVVRILLLLATIIGLLFAASFAIRQIPTVQSVQTAAVIAGLVPAGLILMTTTAYAMGALRMSGRGALIQQSNAVESMSNVNVLCLDKTGTLTANRINFHEIYPLTVDEARFRQILGDYASSTRSGNRTSDALKVGLGGETRRMLDEVPFSSARKWSALSFDDEALRGVVVLGAPEMVLPFLSENAEIGQAQIEAWSEAGLRVLLAAYSPEPELLHDAQAQPRLPENLEPLGVVSFSDELRPEAKETIAGFLKAGIRLKIISGDNPHTVAALAKQAGLLGDVRVVSGLELAEMNDIQVAEVARETTIFGRITPEQKEMLVKSLRAQGFYVAMIGDGVNDVLSLKKAQIGISMESGSAATRGVADIVLLNDSFAVLPAAFMEGQRILNGMEDIMRLFLTRAFYAALIILGTAIIAEAQFFPFVPKHASLITLLTVGAPTFALAAWARPGVPKRGLIAQVMHFVLPASLTLTLAALTVYTWYLYRQVYIPADLGQLTPQAEVMAVSVARTALTTAVILMGLILIPFVEPPIKALVGGDEYSGDWRPTILAGIMLLLYIVILVVEPFRVFWELEVLGLVDYLFIITVVAIWAVVMRYIWWLDVFDIFLGLNRLGKEE